MNLTRTEQYILNFIKRNEELYANNINLLIADMWREQGWSYNDSIYNNLNKVTPGETIKRIRRRLHQYGYIEYSEKVEKETEKQFKHHRNYYSDYLEYNNKRIFEMDGC